MRTEHDHMAPARTCHGHRNSWMAWDGLLPRARVQEVL